MRIAHVSDIHIRNLKFHQDYRRVFEDFYRKLEELRVDLVVNTGDTGHTKTNISPEFVGMTSDHCTEIAKRAPYIIILGNHDLNLMNPDREDAITPVVEALANPRVVLLKRSGLFDPAFDMGFVCRPCVQLWNFGISDVGNWPRPPYDPDHVNVGLFHGSIKNCITDSNFRMTHTEYDQNIFEGLDFVMMGDIHKRQPFNDGRAWYAGSMIQQNFGEDPDKGFLLWDIRSKDEWKVDFVELKGSRRFYTIRLPEDLRVPEMAVEPDSRIRIAPPRQLTLVEQKTVEKLVRKRYEPHDVITLGVQNVGQMFAEASGGLKIENLRDTGVQESLLRRFLEGRKLSPEVLSKVLELNRKYQLQAEQRDETARGVNWRVLKMGWNDLYNYGEGNVVDFGQIRGVSGIFAPNASGKSGLIDVITVGMFDANTKEVSKNVHLINDNKERAVIILELLANKERFTIQREIERIKVGKRKGEEREWGKTTLDFVRHDQDGGIERLVAESRPDTEKKIRRRFGSFEDFMLTSLFAQWDPMDLIMCKETDRKRILFRFLDLDIFEEKAELAKAEAREWLDRLAELEEGNYEVLREQLREEQDHTEGLIAEWEQRKQDLEGLIAQLHEEIENHSRQILPMMTIFRKIESSALAAIEKKIGDTSGRALALDLSVSSIAGEIESCHRAMMGYDADEVDGKVKELEELESALFSVNAGAKEHQSHVDDRKRQIDLLNFVPCGDQYPGCQFLVDAFRAKEELPAHQKEIYDLGMEAQRLQEEIKKLSPWRERRERHLELAEELDRQVNKHRIAKLQLENASLVVQNLETELAQARLEVERYEQVKRDLEKNDLIQDEIARMKRQLSEQELGLRDVERRLRELDQEMGARRTDLERLDKQIATTKEVRDTCSAFEHFTDAMGKDGIALQVLTQKLPIINEEINKILQPAAEFGAFIEYDPEDQSIRLYLQYGQYKSRILELGSGAEKFLASVAIRTALLSISNLPRSNMLIIDEGFGKLDPQNLESIQRMFDYLRSVFDHVIVISHTDVMKDMVDNIIEIVADDEGYAHVEHGD